MGQRPRSDPSVRVTAVLPLGSATDDALATLARGVTQRVVYSRESLEHPGHLKDVIELCIKAYEQARVLPSVPVKLVIIDEAYALVSLSIKEADVHNTMLVVQPCGLLSALMALFEQSWQNALPFHGRTTRQAACHPPTAACCGSSRAARATTSSPASWESAAAHSSAACRS